MAYIPVTEVAIISVDDGDGETWAIEGEISFESGLQAPFSVTYIVSDDELEDFEMETETEPIDMRRLKKMILAAIAEE